LHLQTNDKLIPVEGHSDLARDPNTGAIVNINSKKIADSRERKRIKRKNLQEQQELKAKVEGLESDISDMKNMLSQLIEKL
jgi:hypothetical protein